MIGVVAPRDLPLTTFNFFCAVYFILLSIQLCYYHPNTSYPIKVFKILVHPNTTHPVTKVASC